jgi:hypothetical protein
MTRTPNDGRGLSAFISRRNPGRFTNSAPEIPSSTKTDPSSTVQPFEAAYFPPKVKLYAARNVRANGMAGRSRTPLPTVSSSAIRRALGRKKHCGCLGLCCEGRGAERDMVVGLDTLVGLLFVRLQKGRRTTCKSPDLDVQSAARTLGRCARAPVASHVTLSCTTHALRFVLNAANDFYRVNKYKYCQARLNRRSAIVRKASPYLRD